MKHRLHEDFASLSRLLSVLLGFASLTLFADGIYMPLKALGFSLYRHELDAFATFLDQVVPLLPALLLLGALWQGRRLFRQLSVGDPLSPQAAAGVRRTGEWIISAAVTGLFIGEMFSGAPGWALLAGLGAARRVGRHRHGAAQLGWRARSCRGHKGRF